MDSTQQIHLTPSASAFFFAACLSLHVGFLGPDDAAVFLTTSINKK